MQYEGLLHSRGTREPRNIALVSRCAGTGCIWCQKPSIVVAYPMGKCVKYSTMIAVEIPRFNCRRDRVEWKLVTLVTFGTRSASHILHIECFDCSDPKDRDNKEIPHAPCSKLWPILTPIKGTGPNQLHGKNYESRLRFAMCIVVWHFSIWPIYPSRLR